MNTTSLISESDLPEHEAARLLAGVLGVDLSHVRAGVEVGDAERATFGLLVARRRSGEPLQYLEGTAPFGPVDVAVDPRVLIPRPETEHLWELAVAAMPGERAIVVDIGTGSGALALAMAYRFPDARVIATDISDEALEAARANSVRLGLAIEFHHGDLFRAVPADVAGRIDVIVSNPPYIPEGDWSELPAEVREHEPRAALVGGPDGLDIVRRLTAGASAWLAPGGCLLVEIGEEQGAVVLASLPPQLTGRIEPDLTGRDRYLVAARR